MIVIDHGWYAARREHDRLSAATALGEIGAILETYEKGGIAPAVLLLLQDVIDRYCARNRTHHNHTASDFSRCPTCGTTLEEPE